MCTKPFEDPPPSSAELFAVQNLVEHHGTTGHIDGTNPRSLPVLLIRDHNPILVHALPGSYPAMERVLPDVGEHVTVGAEVGEYLFQFGERGMSHVVSTIAARQRLRQTFTRNRSPLTSGLGWPRVGHSMRQPPIHPIARHTPQTSIIPAGV
jgi:hypothetical protein